MEARTARGRAHARAALVGNPSDAYGGAVLALTLAELAAGGELRESMLALGRLAHEAADRLRERRPEELGDLMERSFEARRRLLVLDPRHERMIEIARAHGAPANYAGSGGAIVGIRPGRDAWNELSEALGAEGCTVLEPAVTGPRAPDRVS
jgi:mevalonate kinase